MVSKAVKLPPPDDWLLFFCLEVVIVTTTHTSVGTSLYTSLYTCIPVHTRAQCCLPRALYRLVFLWQCSCRSRSSSCPGISPQTEQYFVWRPSSWGSQSQQVWLHTCSLQNTRSAICRDRHTFSRSGCFELHVCVCVCGGGEGDYVLVTFICNSDKRVLHREKKSNI